MLTGWDRPVQTPISLWAQVGWWPPWNESQVKSEILATYRGAGVEAYPKDFASQAESAEHADPMRAASILIYAYDARWKRFRYGALEARMTGLEPATSGMTEA